MPSRSSSLWDSINGFFSRRSGENRGQDSGSSRRSGDSTNNNRFSFFPNNTRRRSSGVNQRRSSVPRGDSRGYQRSRNPFSSREDRHGYRGSYYRNQPSFQYYFGQPHGNFHQQNMFGDMFGDFQRQFFPTAEQAYWAAEQEIRERRRRGEEEEAKKGVPPASKRFLEVTKDVIITDEDMKEESNAQCLICLEDQKVGGHAMKLPCGHLFHRPCVTDWLQRHCTCPVCRFEIETDNPNFERERRERMRTRKRRYRLRDLTGMSVMELRQAARDLNLDISNCIEKQEIIDKMIRSDLVQMTDEHTPEYSLEELQSSSISTLKSIASRFQVDVSQCLEKREIISALVNSGRIITHEGTRTDLNRTNAPFTAGNMNGESVPNTPQFSVAFLETLSVTELKRLMEAHRIDAKNCWDRSDLMERLRQSANIHIC